MLLTAVKESYLFGANAYGLFHHPALTLTRLCRDRSQLLLFFSALITLISLISLIFIFLCPYVFR
jgi:hypothetical protein